MATPPQKRKRRNAARIDLLVSLAFHGAIVLVLAYFAAREGLLGHELKKITVEIVKPEKPPEKPREPAKPKEEPPKAEPPAVAVRPPVEAPREARPAPPPATVATAPVAVAPPPSDVPSFEFEGGKAVQTSSDPVQLYRGFVEFALRSKWVRPEDIADDNFVAEVEMAVGSNGTISGVQWKKGSGNSRWDDSVRAAITATDRLDRPPPANFPPRIVVRFDVQDATEPILQ